MFRVLPHLQCEALSCQFCTIWLNWEYNPIHLRVHLVSVLSIHSNGPVPLAAREAITLPPPCLTRAVGFFAKNVPFFLHTFLFPTYSYKFIFVPSVQRICFSRLFWCFSNLLGVAGIPASLDDPLLWCMKAKYQNCVTALNNDIVDNQRWKKRCTIYIYFLKLNIIRCTLEANVTIEIKKEVLQMNNRIHNNNLKKDCCQVKNKVNWIYNSNFKVLW